MGQSSVDPRAGRMHTVNETTFKVGRVIKRLDFELLIRDPQFTYASPITLNGISRNKMRAPVVFGLPGAYFDLALRWEAKDALEPQGQKTKQKLRTLTG
jgi:hypothetical protein